MEKAHCTSEIQPCEMAIRLEERIGQAEGKVKSNTDWLLRLDSALHDLSLDTAREIAILKTKLLFVSALGALAGSSLGAIISGIVVYKITRG
jgi:hypothetical protein